MTAHLEHQKVAWLHNLYTQLAQRLVADHMSAANKFWKFGRMMHNAQAAGAAAGLGPNVPADGSAGVLGAGRCILVARPPMRLRKATVKAVQ